MLDELFGGLVAANDNALACVRCGEPIPSRSGPGRKAMYCSDSCRNAPARTIGSCHRCGAPTFGTKAKKFCTEMCRNIHNNDRYKAMAIAESQSATPIRCKECGSEFLRPYASHRKVFCSERCSRKDRRRKGRASRRALMAGVQVENVDPIRVFERDGWRCQICFVKTPKSLRGMYDNRAPELDHVLPISLGGAHSYMNTQCSCRLCNLTKGNMPPAQQSLFASIV